jgi:hypothetical protein
VRLEEYWEAVNLDLVVWDGGAMGTEIEFVGLVVAVGM